MWHLHSYLTVDGKYSQAKKKEHAELTFDTS